MFKKGYTATNVVMFLTAMMAVMIGFMWIAKNNYPFQRQLGQVDHQLAMMQIEFGAACSSPYYESRINPTLEAGLLSIRDSEVCVNSNLCNKFMPDSAMCSVLPGIFRCRPLICKTGLSEDINLKDIAYIFVEKNETFEITTQ